MGFLKRFTQREDGFYTSKKVIWFIICFGILLRIAQYLFNRSLWIDEAHITIDILGQFSELFNPFYENLPSLLQQTAPFGFFILEKFAVMMLGESEYVLRLFPLLFGISSLVLFYAVAKIHIKPKAVPIALALFAVSDSYIYVSSELNQYSSDIFIALFILYLANQIKSKNLSMSYMILFSVTGALVIWFSSSSVFVLAGIGASLALFSLIRKDFKKTCSLSVVFAVWAFSFIVYHLFYLKNLSNNTGILNTWIGENAFMPFPPTSPSDIWWFIGTFYRTFANPTLTTFGNSTMLAVGGIASFAFVIGSAAMLSGEKERFYLLLSPAVVALFASGLYLYPFLQRTILFMTPSLILIVAEGVEDIRSRTAGNAPVIGISLLVLLLFYPLISASYHIFVPRAREEVKPVLGYIRENWHEGDMIYVHNLSLPAFKYYSKKFDFAEDDYSIGRYAGDENNVWAFSFDDLKTYINDIEKLRNNKRLWVLFAHSPPIRGGINEVKFILYHLNSIGRRLDSYKSAQSEVYLYELSESASRGGGP